MKKNKFILLHKNGTKDMTIENAKNSSPKRSSKKGNNGLIKILLVILLLAVISIFITLLLSTQRSKTQTADLTSELFSSKSGSAEDAVNIKQEFISKKKKTEQNQASKSGNKLEGSWLCITRGNTLTLKNDTYTIDYSCVEAKKPMIGTYKITDDKIVFIDDSESGTCQGFEGIYKFSFQNDIITMKSIDDECTKRCSALDNTEWKRF